MKIYYIGAHAFVLSLIAMCAVCLGIGVMATWRAHEATEALRVSIEREREAREAVGECRDLRARMHVYEELFGLAKASWRGDRGTGGE